MYKINNIDEHRTVFIVEDYLKEDGLTLYSKLKSHLTYESDKEGNKLLTKLKQEEVLDLIKIEKELLDLNIEGNK
jgi:hypothetical protein